jgi:hypothetical protein
VIVVTSPVLDQYLRFFQGVEEFAGQEFGLRWENGVRVTTTGVEMFSNRNMDILEIG